jgi:hypothetical protein
MKTGWIVGVAMKAQGRVEAEDYAVAIDDMVMALNAVRRLVGRRPDTHVWVKEPLRDAASQLAPGTIRRQATPREASDRVQRRAGGQHR